MYQVVLKKSARYERKEPNTDLLQQTKRILLPSNDFILTLCQKNASEQGLFSNFGLLGTLPRPIIFSNRTGLKVLWLRRRTSQKGSAREANS
jgi:hypothetical protein